MRTLRNIAISLVVVAVLAGGGFLALSSVSKSNNYGAIGGGGSTASAGTTGAHGALTPAEARSIKLGTSESAIVARFGTPASTDAQELTGCVYYRVPHTILHTWKLCFTNGRLASKARV